MGGRWVFVVSDPAGNRRFQEALQGQNKGWLAL
jgi:hypothetical protein